MHSALPGLVTKDSELQEKGLKVYLISFGGKEGWCHQSLLNREAQSQYFSLSFHDIMGGGQKWGRETTEEVTAANMKRPDMGKCRELKGRKMFEDVREILRSDS